MINSFKKKVQSLKLKSIQESTSSANDHETFYQLKKQRSPRSSVAAASSSSTLNDNPTVMAANSRDSLSLSVDSSFGSANSPTQLMPSPRSPRIIQLSSTSSSPNLCHSPRCRLSTALPSPRLSIQSSSFQQFQSHIRFIFLASGESGRKTLSKLIRYNLEPEVIEKQAFDLNQSYSTLYYFLSNVVILLEMFYQMLFELKFENQTYSELPPILENVSGEIRMEICNELMKIEEIPLDREFSITEVTKLSYNVPMVSNCNVVLTKLITKSVYERLVSFFERADTKLLIRKYHDVLQTQQHGTIFDRLQILKSTSHETLCELLEKPSNTFSKVEESIIWRMYFIARQKLTGCSQFTLSLGPHKLSFCLVAGQRSERKKYPRYIEQGFEYVIFCINLSEYNRNLYENDTIERFRDTIHMAHEYCCQDCKKFGAMSVIPVFTHIDQLVRQVYFGISPTASNVWIPMCEEIAKLHTPQKSNFLDFILSNLSQLNGISHQLKYFANIVGYPEEEFERKFGKSNQVDYQLSIQPPPCEESNAKARNFLTYFEWRNVTQYLQIRELVSLSQTCKTLHQITSENAFWEPLLKSTFGIDTSIEIVGDDALFTKTEGFQQFIRYFQDHSEPLESKESINYRNDWKTSYKWLYLFCWSCVKIQKMLFAIVLTKSGNNSEKIQFIEDSKVSLTLNLSDWKAAAQSLGQSNLYNKFV